MDKLILLERVFGYRSFRQGQESLIDAILAGRDVFGIMPTGGGKSVCYQLPALMLPGITVVVSPRISLMQDQVMALKAAGVPAAYINSTLSHAQMQLVYKNLLAGQYKIVYVAPERLDYPGFGALVSRLQISFLAVDEAHCISQWGQDFRPSYLRILQFANALAHRPVIGAYTATATAQVREDVERILMLNDPVRVITGFDRPNLYFDVVKPKKKDDELIRILVSKRFSSGIVYCSTRKKVESVCEMLREHGYRATRYHAGLTEKERRKNQEDFLYDRKTVMVATNAFGMGIDKSNVSFVIHYNMPKSLEAYYQEAGRAGRDGTDAECVLLFSSADISTAKFLINNGSENEELDLEQREAVLQQDLARLDAMVGYCKTRECLRGYILNYFGQKHPEHCGNCGTCQQDLEEVDITKEAQMILSCVKRIGDYLGYHMGSAMVARVLQGSKEKKLQQLGLDGLSTYGLMKTTGRTEIRAMIDHLEIGGYLRTGENGELLLTPEASSVLYRGASVRMMVKKEERANEADATTQKFTGYESELYEALRELRMELAKEAGIPPFMVFSNATLKDMARKKPTTTGAFRRVSGVGEIKAAWYAEPFLEKIREFADEYE